MNLPGYAARRFANIYTVPRLRRENSRRLPSRPRLSWLAGGVWQNRKGWHVVRDVPAILPHTDLLSQTFSIRCASLTYSGLTHDCETE